MALRDIPYYKSFISDFLNDSLLKQAQPVQGVQGLVQIGEMGGLETKESFEFLCKLYEKLKGPLNEVLKQRAVDREFIDARTKSAFELNKFLGHDYLDPAYETVIGQKDSKGRVVVGPLNKFYCRSGVGQKIKDLPEHLKGHHVTLFGPPDDAKLSINAMNAFHRKLKNEPAIVSQLLAGTNEFPKWGADDEDSKTPLRDDFISAGVNLTDCFNREISFTDPVSKKDYRLEEKKLSLPIKRFPGLAMPCLFLFYRGNSIPLHLYDFALHFFENYKSQEALSFYVPKLETPEEAAYIRLMIETAEKLIQEAHDEYVLGSVRLFVVLENPRLIFRTNELMDELYPYFAGASLGWHDYLASTARLFKEDANYRIPVKADPNIVIKYIKASHELLAEVVGSRGGIKIGGMYGVLPIDNDLKGDSFQLTIRGYIKDVITQLKRDLSGFWVAHPDFVRLGLALVEAWKIHQKGDVAPLETLVTELLDQKFHPEILKFIREPDLTGLDLESPLYARSLIVADMKESQFIANNHPDEIRYNVFQSLQYLTDWLSGNGCVALPAHIEGVSVRVMDDLATAERSRWEVWHEIYHGRFSVDEFLKIAAEEMLFIRKNLSRPDKIVQVKWNERTEKWYPVAFHLMLLLMTDHKPVEFASELLLPFTVPMIRNSPDPLLQIQKIDPAKYRLTDYVDRFSRYFSACGSEGFAHEMASLISCDLRKAEKLIMKFDIGDIISAASFHGDIGEDKRTLDHSARNEQSLVEDSLDRNKLRERGSKYQQKFGFKFLVSAQGKTAEELSDALRIRFDHSREQEIENAKEALWQIAKKRLLLAGGNALEDKVSELVAKHKVKQAQITLSLNTKSSQDFALGTSPQTFFELASLSKTIASCFAVEYFHEKNILLTQSVNALLRQTNSRFQIISLDPEHPEWAERVSIQHLMEHTALNMHYVNGFPLGEEMPSVRELLENGSRYGYSQVAVDREPGVKFQYSGGGFLVLEHLIESLEGKTIQEITHDFLSGLSSELSFDQKVKGAADGYLESGSKLRQSRKMFPAFAAGAMGTARGVQGFLSRLTEAFRNVRGSGAISHSTAVRMLFGLDRSSRQFMGADMGLGVFTAQAGSNRFALHQGANDGFRCLFLQCYDGPDRGKGFTILCSGELNAVLFIGAVSQLICRELNFGGINFNSFSNHFDPLGIESAEIVNQAYKTLIFDAFEPDLPERITNRVHIDPILDLSLSKDANILEVSNQGFARAENLFSPFAPVYDPELYGRQGKTMDSWESVRHNQLKSDFVIFMLKRPAKIRFALASTQFHLGNQAPAITLEAFDEQASLWVSLIEKTNLSGHAIQYFKLNPEKAFQKFKISQIPDGGLTRFGLFDKIVTSEESHEFVAQVPQPLKPMTPKYNVSRETIERNLKNLQRDQEFNVASLAYGARIIKASNEHYGPAVQIISPYPPLHMFDGFESARSRESGHHEEVFIGLARASIVHRIEIDFSFFKNNNPLEIEIFGISENRSIQLLSRTNVKAYAGNIFEFKVDIARLIDQVQIKIFPDGGMNRVRVFTKA